MVLRATVENGKPAVEHMNSFTPNNQKKNLVKFRVSQKSPIWQTFLCLCLCVTHSINFTNSGRKN